jgi:ring-1,2-phenylacetyl-CoA epoxidase subunit PaaC
MHPHLTHALAELFLSLADDELILGHRNSEWAGHGPILEEDIAFANIALDEIGHAAIWYDLRCQLTGEETDQLVFLREARHYRNIQMVELPKGDWAFSMLRQFLFDLAEQVRLEVFAESPYQPLATAAAKIRTEERYHYRHTSAWVKRLGLGTEESHRRMQTALDQLWPYTLQLFAPWPQQELLLAEGVLPHPEALQSTYESRLFPALEEAGLSVPPPGTPAAAS